MINKEISNINGYRSFITTEEKMKIDVYLYDTTNGKSGKYQPDYDIEEPFNPYGWEKGNFSCDCNRSIFLYGDDIYECGHNKIKIKICKRDTGEVLYNEME